MTDPLNALMALMARIDPNLVPLVAPAVEEVREEYGGRNVYIASPRAQRQRNMRAALQTQPIATVAQRYRVSRRTVQRLVE